MKIHSVNSVAKNGTLNLADEELIVSKEGSNVSQRCH